MEYGLIGEKLGHSWSQIIHRMLADYTYELIPLSKNEFTTFMEQKDFKAINVTIPYKQDVIPYLDELDLRAQQIEAVNTIVNRAGKLYGYNTDVLGFIYTLKANHIIVADKKCVVLGCGGSSKAIIAGLTSEGAKEIIVVNRNTKEGVISYDDCKQYHTDAEIIVNTTPVGMYPNIDASPLDLTPFTSCNAFIDIIYNPLETKSMQQASQLGIKAYNGLQMLVAQAKYAVEYFLDCTIEDSKIEEVTKKLMEDMKGK